MCLLCEITLNQCKTNNALFFDVVGNPSLSQFKLSLYLNTQLIFSNYPQHDQFSWPNFQIVPTALAVVYLKDRPYLFTKNIHTHRDSSTFYHVTPCSCK